MFAGFAPLTGNFTLTPNQFFDQILYEEDCVVKVVGLLIRETLGWEDPRTKARRVEASLPMSAFSQRGLSRNSVRKGLDLALQRGYIVKTAEETSRTPARYALRWEDGEGQAEAVRRERLASEERGSKNDPVKFCASRGSKNDPPFKQEILKENKKEKKQTLNVREGGHFVDLEENPPPTARNQTRQNQTRQNLFDVGLAGEAGKIVEELRDWGSERRHRQLVSICEQHGLFHLCSEALQATRQRLANEQKHGVLEKPGAYYQRVLVQLLERHQVFVPTSGEEGAEEVRRLARTSLGLEES